jgi:sugar phosphate isomerase/epimerase
MKLAFSTLACTQWTLEQAVANGRMYGYEGIELRLLDGELLQSDLPRAARERVRAVCAGAGLPIVCVDTSVKIAQGDPAQLGEGLRFLELAAAWEAPFMRVFGGPPAHTDEATAIEAAIACLAPLAERGRELGVTVALETHDAFAGSTVVAQVLQQVPGFGAGALWDTLHPYRTGETIATTIGELAGRLVHVHVKDGRPPRDGSTNWQQTLLGEGHVPVHDVLAALRTANYTGWLAAEWEKKWHPELAEPEVALPQHVEALRTYLAE